MRNTFSATLLCLCLGYAGCSPKSSTKASAAAAPRSLEITAFVHSVGKLFRIEGQTNLPDETKLLVTLNRPKGRMMGQGDATVTAGRFVTPPFSDHRRPYRPGPYRLTVSAAVSDLQPDAVKAVIGPGYANYTGSAIDHSEQGAFVDYETMVQVGR